MPSTGARRAASDERLDAVFHALSDRTRRALLERLAVRPAMVTELALPFAMSLPAVSRHIRVLETAGLIERSVDGRIHHCSLAPAPLQIVEAWLSRYRRFWQEKLDSLARFVESDEDACGAPERGKHGR